MEPEFYEQHECSKREILEAIIIAIGGLASSISTLVILYLAIYNWWILICVVCIGLVTIYSIKHVQ